MADVPRQYPHVSEIADPKAARSIRLLWDAVSAIQDRTTAVESTTADHTATLATVQSTLTATTILAAQAQPAAAKTTAAIAGGAPVGGDNPPPTSDNGQGADGCTQAGVNGHITPGTVLSPFVIGQVVCGVANEFPTLFDPQPDQPTLDATRTCYMNRVIWHLNLAGFQASHYGSDPTSAGGSRLAFAPDGTVYITISGAGGRTAAGADPRKLETVYGKVIRLRDDGTVPPDNPFVGTPGARPEIYTMGHRDHFGIAPHPTTGQMFHVELGPYGGDKVNVLKAGGDYGWPDYSYGRNNDSSPIPNPNNVTGIEPALLVWVPGITPSGLLFYTGDKFPAWKGNLMVGSVVRGRVNGASGVERVVFNDKMWETRRETFLAELKQRIRDIRQTPDGLIYLLTEEVNGAVLKLEPAD